MKCPVCNRRHTTNHRPPHIPLRIVRLHGYELAVQAGEDVGELVAEAQESGE